MIHIAIDGNEANVLQRVGSNVYAFELLKQLFELIRNDPEVRVTVLLAEPPIKDWPSGTDRWQYQVIGPKPLWTQWALPIHLFQQRDTYHVFFTPGHYAPRWSPIPYVSSVMDLAYLFYPDQFRKKDVVKLTKWTAYSVKRAAKIITISESSKQDVVKEYGRNPDDVLVAYPGLSEQPSLPNGKHQARILNKFGIKNPYFLYVGTLQPRKNLAKLIEAFEVFERQRRQIASELAAHSPKSANYPRLTPNAKQVISSETQLVIAGKIGWLAEDIIDRINRSPFKNQIVVTDFISDEVKHVLYHNAIALTLLGLYEGFGIPPLEAMSHGTVPIVSDTSSLPEVVGKAGIIVNPTDDAAIAHAMMEVALSSRTQRAQLRKQMKTQIKKFDWMQSAQVVFNCLKDLAAIHAK